MLCRRNERISVEIKARDRRRIGDSASISQRRDRPRGAVAGRMTYLNSLLRYGFPVFGASRASPESPPFTPKPTCRSALSRCLLPIRQLFTPDLPERPCTTLYSGLHTNPTMRGQNGRRALRTSSGTPFGSTPHRLWVTSDTRSQEHYVQHGHEPAWHSRADTFG